MEASLDVGLDVGPLNLADRPLCATLEVHGQMTEMGPLGVAIRVGQDMLHRGQILRDRLDQGRRRAGTENGPLDRAAADGEVAGVHPGRNQQLADAHEVKRLLHAVQGSRRIAGVVRLEGFFVGPAPDAEADVENLIALF